MQVNVRFGLQGLAKLHLYKRRTGRIRKVWHLRNLIADAGLEQIGTGITFDQLIGYAGAGTDNTAPAAGQVGLVAEVGPAAANRTNFDGGIADTFGIEPTYTWMRRTRVFTEAQVVGTLRELGIFRNVSGAPMWSRFLVTDSIGDPDFVEKAADDELRLTYELRIFPPTVEVENEFTIKQVEIVAQTRAVNFADNDAWGANGEFFTGFGTNFQNLHQAHEENAPVAIDADVPAGGTNATGSTVIPYVPLSLERLIKSRWNPPVANFVTGVGGLSWRLLDTSPLAQFHTVFDPKIEKLDTERLNVTLAVSWGRHS
jgi:hypothetical protein